MKQGSVFLSVKTLSVLGASAACLGFAGTASAQNWGAEGPASKLGPYVEAGATYHGFEGSNGVNNHAWAPTARAGIRLLPMLSVEAEAGFGVDGGNFDFQGSEDDFNLDDNNDGDVADIINAPGDFGLNYMLGAYGKLSFPVTPQFEVFGRAGYAFADVDSKVVTPGGGEIKLGSSEDGPSFGAGLAYHLSDNSAIRADYTYTDFDFAEDNAVGLVYQIKF
ncbi:MAG: porin family protein [Caulobacterales bacterium]